jgi:Fic family protein
MFKPNFDYTDKLVSSLIKLENIKTQLSLLDFSYPIKHKLSLNSKTNDIFHLGHILGLDMTLKDAEKIAGGLRLDGFKDQNAFILNNFRGALEFNRSNIADTYSEVDFTVLLHINKLITSNWRETWDSRFRSESDEFIDKDEWSGLRDTSILGSQVQNLMIELVEWYKTLAPSVTPVVRIGIILHRITEIAPYYAANTLSVVGLADYLLVKNGFAGKIYSSFVRNFDVNKHKYKEAFEVSRKSNDLTYWLETLTENLVKELSETKEDVGKFNEEDEKSKNQPFLDLNKRQLKVLRYLQTVPMIKREDYCHMMEVSTMTAFRDLNDLVRKRLIKVDGKGRGTKYRLSSL